MKKMETKKTAAILATAIAVALAGCGAKTESPATAAGAATGATKIGVVLKTTSNQFWSTMKDGAETSAAASKVTVTVQSASSEKGIEEQANVLQNMVAGDYGCFAVAPITATNLIQPLAAAQKAKKFIVNLDSGIDASAASAAGLNIASFIASNNEDAGKQAGEFMVQKLGGKGKVAVVGGISGDANSNARTKGFIQAAKAGGLTIVQEVAADWDREKALNAATAILQANPDIGGFYAANDGMALGIVQAKQNEGKKAVLVIGTDGNKDAIESIKSGGLTATVSQYPSAIGALGVDACRAAMSGATLPKAVDAPIALVSADNAEKALKSYPNPFDAYTNPFTALIK